jgi:hypothetical protein
MYIVPHSRIIGSGLRGPAPRRRRRLLHMGFMGQDATLTPQQAVTQAQSGFSNLNPADWNNPTFLAAVYQNVANGNIPTASFSAACAGIIAANPDLTLTQAAGSIAGATTGSLATAAAGTTAGAVLGAATFGIGVVVAIVSLIFAHHAAAVKAEQNYGCVAIAGFNNSMAAINEGVASGQIAPADAVTALNTVYSQFQSTVAPSYSTSPYCSADCEAQLQVKASVLYWQSQYQAMADAAASAAAPAATAPTAAQIAANPLLAVTAPVQNAVATAAASTGLPAWMIWALGGFLLYEAVK